MRGVTPNGVQLVEFRQNELQSLNMRRIRGVKMRGCNKILLMVTPSEAEGSVEKTILSDSSTPPLAPLGMTIILGIHHILGFVARSKHFLKG